MQGKKFVLTGIFPEVGGGAGLSLGKVKVTQMIQSFGGTVASSVSGKTSYLMVGKNPGFNKVKEARMKQIPQVDLNQLKVILESGTESEGITTSIKANPEMIIDTFSAGFGKNSLALRSSEHDIGIAMGLIEPPKLLKNSASQRKSKKEKLKQIKNGKEM